MNYLESIAYLDSLSPTLEKPGLNRISVFLAEHGAPQNAIPTFHVGGTNGKGSTVAILDSVLRQCGFKVARFTGPHLLRWNERFHVDGCAIEDGQFAAYASELRTLSEAFAIKHPKLGALTWFEFITVLAFRFFADQKVDISVVEVGLGGRFDATNVLDNLLASVITNVDLDHKHILGDTVELIAVEKAGIINESIPVITAAKGAALDVIAKKALALNAPLYALFGSSAKQITEIFPENAEQSPHLLMGEHQKANALLAYAALRFCVGKMGDEIRARLDTGWEQGLSNTYWAGRMQYLPKLNVILDGAHNPAGAIALRAALDAHFCDKKCLFVITCFDNKDALGILQAVTRSGDRIFFSEAKSRREVFSNERLQEISSQLGIQSKKFQTVAVALAEAIKGRCDDEIIVATGSFATVRESMLALDWHCVEDGRKESGRIGDVFEVSSH